METKEVLLCNGQTVKVRGRTSWEVLDRKEQVTKTDSQLDVLETCILEPKWTREEIRTLLSIPADMIAVDNAIFSLENPKSNLPASQLKKN